MSTPGFFTLSPRFRERDMLDSQRHNTYRLAGRFTSVSANTGSYSLFIKTINARLAMMMRLFLRLRDITLLLILMALMCLRSAFRA